MLPLGSALPASDGLPATDDKPACHGNVSISQLCKYFLRFKWPRDLIRTHDVTDKFLQKEGASKDAQWYCPSDVGALCHYFNIVVGISVICG